MNRQFRAADTCVAAYVSAALFQRKEYVIVWQQTF